MLLLKSFYIIFQYIIAQYCQKSKDQNIKKLLMHCIYSVGLSPGAARLSFYDVIAILVTICILIERMNVITTV